MTPKELEIVISTIEAYAEGAYRLGHADGAAGKPARTDFKANRATRLTIKTGIEKALKAPPPKPVKPTTKRR